jgi:hypothetical protein
LIKLPPALAGGKYDDIKKGFSQTFRLAKAFFFDFFYPLAKSAGDSKSDIISKFILKTNVLAQIEV